MTLFADPAVWAALLTLLVMEIVLGIDTLIFISILSNKLPEAQRQKARRLGIGLALFMRLALLSTIAWLVGLTAPVFDLGLQGAPGYNGEPTYETRFSWRDIILIAGGLFLVWKATKKFTMSRTRHATECSIPEAALGFAPSSRDLRRPRFLDRFHPTRSA